MEKIRGRRGQTSPGEERGNETRKVLFAYGSLEFCEATSIGLADESKKSLYGRETDRDLRNADLRSAPRHVDAWRDIYFYFYFRRTSCVRGGGEGVRCQPFFLFYFSCSSDHERDWSPCKAVFFGLATNTLNARNNNNNNNKRPHVYRLVAEKWTTSRFPIIVRIM